MVLPQMSFKRCFKCKKLKSINAFYRHPTMADGRLGKCKTCNITDAKNRVEAKKHDPVWVEHERARCRNKRRYQCKNRSVISRKWNQNNKDKRRAEGIAMRAVKSGVLEKATTCQMCRNEQQLEMHHPDYKKPLYVIWLCSTCHGTTRRKPFGSPMGL